MKSSSSSTSTTAYAMMMATALLVLLQQAMLVSSQETADLCFGNDELNDIFAEFRQEPTCCQNDICGIPCPAPVSKPTKGTCTKQAKLRETGNHVVEIFVPLCRSKGNKTTNPNRSHFLLYSIWELHTLHRIWYCYCNCNRDFLFDWFCYVILSSRWSRKLLRCWKKFTVMDRRHDIRCPIDRQ